MKERPTHLVHPDEEHGPEQGGALHRPPHVLQLLLQRPRPPVRLLVLLLRLLVLLFLVLWWWWLSLWVCLFLREGETRRMYECACIHTHLLLLFSDKDEARVVHPPQAGGHDDDGEQGVEEADLPQREALSVYFVIGCVRACVG